MFQPMTETNISAYFLIFETKMIIDVLPSRHKNVLSAYFHSVPLDERKNVEYMSSDMWVSYHDISKIFLPDTIRTIDRFHLLMEFSKNLIQSDVKQ
ncbi:MAG: transposase [Thomasclavelia ramosa]